MVYESHHTVNHSRTSNSDHITDEHSPGAPRCQAPPKHCTLTFSALKMMLLRAC